MLLGAATAEAGSAVWASFGIAALLCALTGLSYAELASMYPRAGRGRSTADPDGGDMTVNQGAVTSLKRGLPALSATGATPNTSKMERWISARKPLAASFEHATKMLAEDAGRLLPDPRRRCNRAPIVNLAVDVGRGRAIRQDVEVTLGVACSAEGETWLPISWEPSGKERLLPSFDGVIEVVDNGDSDAELLTTGTYRIPLGPVGHFGDGFIGRRLAQQSLASLLEQMAEQLDEQVGERTLHAGWHPAPYPIDLRERAAPAVH